MRLGFMFGFASCGVSVFACGLLGFFVVGFCRVYV